MENRLILYPFSYIVKAYQVGAFRITIIDLILPNTKTDTIEILQTLYRRGVDFSQNFTSLWRHKQDTIYATIKEIIESIHSSFSGNNLDTITFERLSSEERSKLCLFELLLRTGVIISTISYSLLSIEEL